MLGVVEVEQLVVPLRDDPQRIFEEGDDDEETADCWQISVEKHRIVSSALEPLALTSRNDSAV